MLHVIFKLSFIKTTYFQIRNKISIKLANYFLVYTVPPHRQINLFI